MPDGAESSDDETEEARITYRMPTTSIASRLDRRPASLEMDPTSAGGIDRRGKSAIHVRQWMM